MANPKHAAKFREGIDAWNNWRDAERDTEPDLSGLQLAGVAFVPFKVIGAALEGVQLSRANLNGVNLSRAKLHRANLNGAKLLGANLSEAELLGADLSDANLSEANCNRTFFHRAKLQRVNLNGASLLGANLSESDLSGANLMGAKLNKADLSGAILRDAILENANLSVATLVCADLTRAILTGACIDHVNRSEWIIKNIICSHIQQYIPEDKTINFEPEEFEKKHTSADTVVEMILNIPLTESAPYIGSFIAKAINEVKNVNIIKWKGVEAISDDDTKIAFIVFDKDYYEAKRGLFETDLTDKLNRVLKSQEDLKEILNKDSNPFDIAELASGGLIKTKSRVPISFTPLEVDTKAVHDKIINHYNNHLILWETIRNIVRGIFK